MTTPMDYAIKLYAGHLADLRYSPTTSARYLRVLKEFKQYLATMNPNMTLDAVNRDVIVLFLRQSSGRSASTQNVRLASLRGFFGYLRRQGMLTSNPTEEIEFLAVKTAEPTFLSMREYGRLLRSIRQHSSPSLATRNEAIVVVLFNTGLRVSELVALSLDICDFSTRAFRNVPLKGGSSGSVEWNGETERVLKAWLVERKAWHVRDDERGLFLSSRGTRLSVRAVQDLFQRISRIARVRKRVTPHVLRHSMATELLRQGHDIRVIADLLHHASLNTTRRYAHVVDSLRRKALASLEPKRKPPRTRPRRS